MQAACLLPSQLLLEKIMADNERTAQLLAQREQLQQQRKQANMNASMQRHKVSQAMESLKGSKNIEKLAGGGGGINISALTGGK